MASNGGGVTVVCIVSCIFSILIFQSFLSRSAREQFEFFNRNIKVEKRPNETNWTLFVIHVLVFYFISSSLES